ncbi:hypothetical protein [Streptomyces sp. G1]|uniref:hypothetical protein n=1 Tax=Streptomyces sp. G1 TaxID=361572 RepID=UPI00202E9EFB|nr:hypothetical protein [Streptomyces sp. G1]MCM1970695.1 hypothetical protein [Streptomyces sp. G1]
MSRKGNRKQHRLLSTHLGIQPHAAEWCRIDDIPQPPADVLQAAGGTPRLRPARLPPLGMLGAVLAAPFAPFLLLLWLLAQAEEALKRALDTEEEKRSRRARKDAEKRRDAAIVEHGLDRVFDGNWHGSAGQFLLRWYSHSTHHERLLVATDDGIVLAAPPQRVSVGREKQLRVVARIPTAEATLVDPFGGEFESTLLLIRFRDSSWIRVDTEEPRSELHMHLLQHQPAAES